MAESDTEHNTISIESFPELSSLQTTDKIIVFEKDSNEKLSPKLHPVSDLSNVVVTIDGIEDVAQKVAEVKTAIVNAMNYLRKTFVTKAEAADYCATTSSLEAELAKLEKTADFMDKISTKADITYLDYLYNKIRTDCARVKTRLGDGRWKVSGATGLGYKIITSARAGLKGA